MKEKKMKFLVPIGFTEKPEDVLDKAVEVARKYKAHVYILHVITEMPKLTFYYDAYRLWENFRDSAIVEAMDLLKKHIAKMKDQYNDLEPVVEVGDPATTILEKADELDADLIIMGHHVRKGINHVMHQNSCERVVRFAKRPVLTFHIEHDEE